ncbi:PilN domain-containing protein [Dactylosporangium roseum]|uniref:PilN domain-containing protein n=1 Tax=Dactylosporangium roseum TaxID=47989 RepID=A0ABY5Z0X7_9ACTN|nr:PilN domain-containing protein [Dactylosporangium roseum]UWZ35462.1 PilN domain-containing protein [Dactylosporangium roseum]
MTAPSDPHGRGAGDWQDGSQRRLTGIVLPSFDDPGADFDELEHRSGRDTRPEATDEAHSVPVVPSGPPPSWPPLPEDTAAQERDPEQAKREFPRYIHGEFVLPAGTPRQEPALDPFVMPLAAPATEAPPAAVVTPVPPEIADAPTRPIPAVPPASDEPADRPTAPHVHRGSGPQTQPARPRLTQPRPTPAEPTHAEPTQPRRAGPWNGVPHPAFPDATARTFRILPIAADLLPLEISETRRVRRVRRFVVSGVALVTALVLAWYGSAAYETGRAQRDLDSATDTTLSLTRQQNAYNEQVKTRARSMRITNQLKVVLARDLSWSALLTSLQQAAPKGVKITGVTGSLSADSETRSPGGAVGLITLTGTAPTKTAVASYVDTLGGVEGIANPFPTDATQEDDVVAFTVRMDITGAALGGRYTTPSAAPSASGGN